MTAETLKPFITPQSVDNFPAIHSSSKCRQRYNNCLAISLSATAIFLIAFLFGFECWNFSRVSNLKTEIQNLRTDLQLLQDRLGITVLDSSDKFEEEYANALIDDPGSADDNDDDYDDNGDDNDDNVVLTANSEADDDDEYSSYDELLEKYRSYDDEDEEDNSNDSDASQDDLFDDFEKYKDSKIKKTSNSRNKRTIQDLQNELPTSDETHSIAPNETENIKESQSKKDSTKEKHRSHHTHHLGQNERNIIGSNLDAVNRISPLRHRSNRRRKMPIIKSGESLITAKSLSESMNLIGSKPAAHFHLNRKIPNRHAEIKVHSYPGDLYIGHPSLTNENNFEQYFKVEQGVLSVYEPGYYYVYAQVCYNNTHDQNGFVIFHGHKPFLQCLNTVPTNLPLKIHTCHTSGLIYLEADDTIHLRDFHSDRNAILKDTNNRSYFGLMKI